MVDKELVKRFRQILDDFSSDTDVFATEGRYLVHFDLLKDENGRQCILVLTNDILIIGKVQLGTKKYKLLNAYSYTIIHMETDGSILKIKVDPNVYVFKKDTESISEILRIFQELTYRYEKHSEDATEESNGEKELVEYLVFTEQYECIEPRGFQYPLKITFHDREEMFKYLGCVAKSGFDISSYVYSFLEERFRAGLGRINRIQVLNNIIEDVFDYFYRFFEEQNKLIQDLNLTKEVRKSGLVLLVEKQLKDCFRVLESRVFSKDFEIRCMNTSLELIEQKLKFSKSDFSYLMSYFLKRKDRYKEKCLDGAMKDVERILNDMVV